MLLSTVVDVGVAAEGHRHVEFLVDDLQRLGDAGLAHRAQAVDHRAADHRAARAQRPGLQHVLAAADAAVHPHLDLRADRVDDRRQRLDARRRAVELAPAVVADDDGVGAAVPPPACASSTSMMPFRISLPPHCCLTHSTSGHDRRGSNCSLVHAASELMSLTPLTCPTRLRKVWRLVPAMPRHQRGLVARLSRLRQRRDHGDARQPVLQVLVALADDLQVQRQHQRAALRGLAALDHARHRVAVAHHVQLEPERRAWCARRCPRSSRCSSSTA